jgi:hypothetical protein
MASPPANARPPRLVNACGLVACRAEDHPAWRRLPSIFGPAPQAFTVAGNLSVSRRGIVFRGATSLPSLVRVLRQLLGHAPPTPRLQLLVVSAGIDRCLSVNRGCLLEQRLDEVPWARVASRIEEVCNVVVFHIAEWRGMEAALSLSPWPDAPRAATASVTRRGTLMLRLTWDGTAWEEGAFLEAAATLARFVASLV